MSEKGTRLQIRNADRIDPLRLVEAKRLGHRAMETLVRKPGSPWHDYRGIYSLQLGENKPFIVAEGKGGASSDPVSICQCDTLDDDQFKLLQEIQHENFVTVHGVYEDQKEWSIVTEHMTLSLQEVVGNPHLDSAKLAAIIGQACAPFG